MACWMRRMGNAQEETTVAVVIGGGETGVYRLRQKVGSLGERVGVAAPGQPGEYGRRRRSQRNGRWCRAPRRQDRARLEVLGSLRAVSRQIHASSPGRLGNAGRLVICRRDASGLIEAMRLQGRAKGLGPIHHYYVSRRHRSPTEWTRARKCVGDATPWAWMN